MTPQEIEALRIEALKDKVEALSGMVEILKAERDALAAQVNVLIDAALDAFSVMNGSPEKVNLCAVLRATPQQCLRDVQAEAVSQFAKYLSDSGELNFSDSNFVLSEAHQYAESARQGGAE